jgi:hypothetical protein
MSSDEIRERAQRVWDRFYDWRSIWKRSSCVSSVRARLAFLFVSKLYRQMYAKTGISSDSARKNRAHLVARWLAKPCRRLFQAKPMPGLELPLRTEAVSIPAVAGASAATSTKDESESGVFTVL